MEENLEDIDKDLIDSTDNFSKQLSAETFSKFQKRYLDHEVMATQHNELAQFEAIINTAKKNNADDLAPETLRTAQTDFNVAMNSIEQTPRKKEEYKNDVMTANRSAKLLDDVMNKLLGEAKGSSENVALKLVYQERKLGKLSSTVNELETEIASKNANILDMNQKLQVKNTHLLSQAAQLRYQQAMDDVRKNFSPEEAEVYQQGDKLILRLKNLKFASGSSTIPTDSMPLLSKIGGIVKNLEPEKIVVQGHTDSVGSTDYNQKLSKKRAEAVSEYLASNMERTDYSMDTEGLGESKPLANNETQEGRSLNRRVDIVIDTKL